MTDINKIIERKKAEIARYCQDTFPRKAGKIAIDHIRENFSREGYINNGLKRWKPAKRKSGKGTKAEYKTLHSGRNNLANSFRSSTENGKAIISTDVEYAAIHNYGGNITHPITRKQRVKAMETHINKTGSRHRDKNSMWKGLALTRKTSYVIHMPQRQFIGASHELIEDLKNTAKRDLLTLLKQ